MAQHLSGPAGLEAQVALITGRAGGMGRAIATTNWITGTSLDISGGLWMA